MLPMPIRGWGAGGYDGSDCRKRPEQKTRTTKIAGEGAHALNSGEIIHARGEVVGAVRVHLLSRAP